MFWYRTDKGSFIETDENVRGWRPKENFCSCDDPNLIGCREYSPDGTLFFSGGWSGWLLQEMLSCGTMERVVGPPWEDPTY